MMRRAGGASAEVSHPVPGPFFFFLFVLFLLHNGNCSGALEVDKSGTEDKLIDNSAQFVP